MKDFISNHKKFILGGISILTIIGVLLIEIALAIKGFEKSLSSGMIVIGISSIIDFGILYGYIDENF